MKDCPAEGGRLRCALAVVLDPVTGQDLQGDRTVVDSKVKKVSGQELTGAGGRG